MHIYISAGETSGDLLGAELALRLREKNPSLKITGMGGDRMRAAGVDIIFDAHALNVMGIIEVITHLPKILWMWFQIKHYLKREKPDAVLFIDFPDTHFQFLKTAKKIGAKIYYYVSPQIWAWRYHRIHTLKKYVDHMAVLFSFEEKLYRDAGIPVTFVGHPLAKLVKPTLSTAAAYEFFQLDPKRPIIALFPGSRQSELKYHLSVMTETAQLIRATKPDAQFVLVLANHFKPVEITLPSHIHIIQHNMYDLLQITNAAIAVSGTVTLEIGLMQVPFCAIYRMNSLSHWIAKKLIRVSHICLCNIVAEKGVVRELIQDAVTPEAITAEVDQILTDTSYRNNMVTQLSSLRGKLENTSGVDEWISVLMR